MKLTSILLFIFGILCMSVKSDKLIPAPQILGLALMFLGAFTDKEIKKSVKRN